MNERLLIVYLTQRVNLNLNKLRRINNCYSGLEEALLDRFQKLNNEKWVYKLEQTTSNLKFDLSNFESKLKKDETAFITYFDEDYPESLKKIGDPPLVLYYQGHPENLKKAELITVVGSRKISGSTEVILDTILKPCCEAGIGVVSGLALGVDTLSHKICLEAGAATVAVIGSGLDDDSFYPFINLHLKKQILENGGLIISEYPDGTQASNFTFPRRNRILAGLTGLTWMVQAGKKSGALITVDFALKEGKLIATTPGSIFDNDFQGNIELLKKGIRIITESKDIIHFMGLKIDNKILSRESRQEPFAKNLDNEEKKVYEALGIFPKVVEDISINTGFQVTRVSSILTMLELKGLIHSVGENRWVKCV